MKAGLKSIFLAMVGVGLGSVLLAAPAEASRFHRGPTASHPHKGKLSAGHGHSAHHVEHSSAASIRPHAMDDARATQIQTALVKAGYLQTASGKWDGESADAMRKLQGDNGWQTKLIPDSRALIKLGLGPGSEVPTTGSPVETPALSSNGAPMAGLTAHDGFSHVH